MLSCKECCRDLSEEDSKKYGGYCKSCYQIKQNKNSIDEIQAKN